MTAEKVTGSERCPRCGEVQACSDPWHGDAAAAVYRLGHRDGVAAERERVMREVSSHRFHDECTRGDDCPNVYHVRIALLDGAGR